MKTVLLLLIMLFTLQTNTSAVIYNNAIVDSVQQKSKTKIQNSSNPTSTEKKLEGFSVVSLVLAIISALSLFELLSKKTQPDFNRFFLLLSFIGSYSWAVLLGVIGGLRTVIKKSKFYKTIIIASAVILVLLFSFYHKAMLGELF